MCTGLCEVCSGYLSKGLEHKVLPSNQEGSRACKAVENAKNKNSSPSVLSLWEIKVVSGIFISVLERQLYCRSMAWELKAQVLQFRLICLFCRGVSKFKKRLCLSVLICQHHNNSEKWTSFMTYIACVDVLASKWVPKIGSFTQFTWRPEIYGAV